MNRVVDTNQMSTHNICFYKLVPVIQMSTHSIWFYKENQNTYIMIIIKYAPQEVLCSYFFKACPY